MKETLERIITICNDDIRGGSSNQQYIIDIATAALTADRPERGGDGE